MDNASVKSHLCELLSGVDVRIDQCDTVRIYWKQRIGFVRCSDEGIEVRVMLLPEPDAIVFTAASIVDAACDEREAAEKAAKWLNRVVEVGW